MMKKIKCLLTKEEALDMAKTVIGINQSRLQCSGKHFIEARDFVATQIIHNLEDREVKEFYKG